MRNLIGVLMAASTGGPGITLARDPYSESLRNEMHGSHDAVKGSNGVIRRFVRKPKVQHTFEEPKLTKRQQRRLRGKSNG